MKRRNYVGLDAETDQGRAVLVTTPYRWARVHSWCEVWSFLSDGMRRREARDFSSFNAPYDVRSFLAYWPARALRDMYERERSEWRKVRVSVLGKRAFRFEYRKRVVRCWDVWPYYDCSLDRAARDYLNAPGKLEIPKEWYECMAAILDGGGEDARRVVAYSMTDAWYAEQLREMAARQYRDLGVNPDGARSPASLAARAFPDIYRRRNGKHDNLAFRPAYYGGRTEVYRRGSFKRVWNYDLCSAYPWALSKLPDFAEATVAGADVDECPHEDALYGAYYCAVAIPTTEHIPPFPVRFEGAPLVFPAGVFCTWLSVPELDYARKQGYKLRVVRGWEYLSGKRVPLFGDRVVRWYELRARNPALSLALKKSLNSLYGKLAEQRDGYTEARVVYGGETYRDGKFWRHSRLPVPHACMAVAGACTATVRLRLHAAMSSRPRAIIAAHTDGILASAPLSVETGSGLGTWKAKGCRPAVVVGSGVYAWGDTVQHRGFPVEGSEFLGRLRRCAEETVEIEVRRALTFGDTVYTAPARLNAMVRCVRELDVNFDRKRAWPERIPSFAALWGTRQESESLVVMQRHAIRILKG